MTRKKFRQDINAACQNPPPHVTDIRSGEDGEIIFEYNYLEKGTVKATILQLLALDVDGYPNGNDFMIFARGEASKVITGAFEVLIPIINGKSIQEALQEISTYLHQAVTTGHSKKLVRKDDSDASDAEEFDADDSEDGDEGWMNDDDADDMAFGWSQPKATTTVTFGRITTRHAQCADLKKIKHDLREARKEGFRVGILGDLTTSGIVTVSIRVSKLGISEEAMKAWSLESTQYFLLLIKCQNGYRALDSVKEDATLAGLTEIRLGLCNSRKPDYKSAFDAFNDTSKTPEKHSQSTQSTKSTKVLSLFIGRPLNELFKGRFARIVKFREVYNLSWSGAEQLVQDTQGAIGAEQEMGKYDSLHDDDHSRALPDIVMNDSMQNRLTKDCSLPLVAAQFALRHFVRCTEFCLVCHCSVGSSFEALKPYVCSKPLCLYQYMGLGFGPSIEWEILAQPYVVDLLISFCYAQAAAGRLKDFPVGIDLKVPVLSFANKVQNVPQRYHHGQTTTQAASSPTEKAFTVPYNAYKREFLFSSEDISNGHVLKIGDFVAITSPRAKDFSGIRLHRICGKMLPTIQLDTHFSIHELESQKGILVREDKFMDVDVYLFNGEFDELNDNAKCSAILTLLDMIPQVTEMITFLKKQSSSRDLSLKLWRERMPASVINVLRWIIASNRSCIMQVDKLADQGTFDSLQAPEDRVTGMDGYMQFRFAQGAPDKEQRFLDCLQIETQNEAFPTLWAFHGSPLHNWHSIIREGLHFKEIAHGRAYGNGVYLSNNASTSTSFQGGQGVASWSNSILQISSALSLNEVINKPAAFVSSHPHYVVSNLDWIQARYLFVKTKATHTVVEQSNVKFIDQDPTRVLIGNHGVRLGETNDLSIPITALPKSRRSASGEQKKRKVSARGDRYEPIELSDESDDTCSDDAAFLDDESHSGHTPVVLDSDVEMYEELDEFITVPKKRQRAEAPKIAGRIIGGALIDTSKTSFMPGESDLTNIKILPEPVSSSPAATTQLVKAFKALLGVQETTPADQLGWYIDPERVENMYQWIVELHSFHVESPLATDMKNAGVKAVVIEMLFTSDYPIAPPFVRVVKPRFLPFSQGGGGHVTEGGAICMELLTNSGWTPVSSIEGVLLQIRLAMTSEERPGRLAIKKNSPNSVYGVGEAMVAYERACRAHGWTVPAAFRTLQTQGM